MLWGEAPSLTASVEGGAGRVRLEPAPGFNTVCFDINGLTVTVDGENIGDCDLAYVPTKSTRPPSCKESGFSLASNAQLFLNQRPQKVIV